MPIDVDGASCCYPRAEFYPDMTVAEFYPDMTVAEFR